MSNTAVLKPHLEGEVEFEHYQDGNLWYRTKFGLLFPVPISDIGTATFKRTDRAMLFMRYIRKWIDVREAKDNSIFEVGSDE